MNRFERNLLISGNIWYFGEGMLGPLFAVFAQRIGGDIFDIAWAWATYLIVTGLCFMAVGKIVDRRIDPRKVMVAGYALNAFCTFGYLWVAAPWQLFVVQSGLGIANALATPTWQSLYAKHEDKKHDTYIWGVAGGQAKIITGFAIIIGGAIVSFVSFRELFFLIGIIQIIATLYQARILQIR